MFKNAFILNAGAGAPKEVVVDTQLLVWTYAVYLAISLGVTYWVARTLSKNGRVFLVDAFGGDSGLADSVNHLLVVGFYLINLGYVGNELKFGIRPTDLPGAIEELSSKMGSVLIVLGIMHFFNLFVFTRIRKRALVQSERDSFPPVGPAEI
jgi:hypothetical protein